MHVHHALSNVPGVESVQVFLASEKAVLQTNSNLINMDEVYKAVVSAGYSIAETKPEAQSPTRAIDLNAFTHSIFNFFGIAFSAVLFIIIIGEWFGLFNKVSDLIPWYIGLAIVMAGGYPTFLNVIRAARKRQIISHTLMTIGVIAAILVGEWITAAVVVFFMRMGDYTEHFTTERARRAVKDLSALAPQSARVDQGGKEVEKPISFIQTGDIVIVRPGEKIPVDGVVIAGQATINQSTITGESMPVEVNTDSKVYAATFAQFGSLRIRTTAVGKQTTFGRVIQMVEEAEINRAEVQQFADRFSGYFLPLVAMIALLTYLVRRDPLSVAAVLVVACSCSFALATPIAMLASIGAGAKHGLLIKGGKYIELLDRATVILVDKTGTLTLGQPKITEIIPEPGFSASQILIMAASAEHDSEHPLAEAVRNAALENGYAIIPPETFSSIPGKGVSSRINQQDVIVGSQKLLSAVPPASIPRNDKGQTILFIEIDGQFAGRLTAEDVIRPDAAEAIIKLRSMGYQQIELLTGDHDSSASSVANQLGIGYRANLLPEDKMKVIKEYQKNGKIVVMIGDGVNDAPSLAQADIGIAMGRIGSDIAIEAAHIALMRENWNLIPMVFQIANRTMRVVRGNLIFTGIYNVVGLSLAALGILPPVLAAAAQSLPDLGILANSSRLIRQR